MNNEEISHQESLVNDSFSTIERLENEMATITREFESLDSNNQDQTDKQEQSVIDQDQVQGN